MHTPPHPDQFGGRLEPGSAHTGLMAPFRAGNAASCAAAVRQVDAARRRGVDSRSAAWLASPRLGSSSARRDTRSCLGLHPMCGNGSADLGERAGRTLAGRLLATAPLSGWEVHTRCTCPLPILAFSHIIRHTFHRPIGWVGVALNPDQRRIWILVENADPRSLDAQRAPAVCIDAGVSLSLALGMRYFSPGKRASSKNPWSSCSGREYAAIRMRPWIASLGEATPWQLCSL